MRILHAGHFQMNSVHGTHQALWQLARAQAAAGHDVTILNVGWDLPPDQVAAAGQGGVRLRGLPGPGWGRFWRDESGLFEPLLDELSPDILHFQYVRIPRFVALERIARRRGLPHVVSLHGGLKATEMERRTARKIAYWKLLEEGVHRRAGGIHFISARERDEYYARFAQPRDTDEVIANILNPPAQLPRDRHRLDPAAPRFATFGRYDVWNKGLDLGAAMVRGLHRRGVKAELHLYGSPAGRFEQQMAELKSEYADIPLFDHGFVEESRKLETMASHDFYLQYSRFEGFGMSVVEAMTCGVPVVASEQCDLARDWREAGAADIIPMDPERAAARLVARLRRPEELERIGQRGREWARRATDPAAVAAQMTSFYVRAADAWRGTRRAA